MKNPKSQDISYSVGDKIELRCNTAPSKPAAKLRWYLNDHELAIPANTSSPSKTQASSDSSRGRLAASSGSPLGYNVKVSPIEYRLHYKGIYSAHSTLSFVLQQDDIANSRISFKCLASMRKEVPVQSKQLIVLTPQAVQPSTPSSSLARLRARRVLPSQSSSVELVKDDDSQSRSRAQTARNNHRLQRPTDELRRLSSAQNDLIGSSLPEDSRGQMMYIYEEADATLGATIIDSPETLERYLTANSNETAENNYSNQDNSNSNSSSSDNNNNGPTLEFNRSDNLDYIQLLRDRLSRQRSFPTGGSSSSASHKRLLGTNSLVKSPLYLDELDPLRPVISWPPLDSGRLMLLPPGHSIAAIPSQQAAATGSGSNSELKFVLPPRPVDLSESIGRSASRSRLIPFADDPLQVGQATLERLVESLNCTCSEGSIDTKLNWLVNERPLGPRDVRPYATRVSADHRQSWLTVGLQLAGGQLSGLQTILSQYYKPLEELAGSWGAQAAALRLESRSSMLANQLATPAGNEQIRFACQASHSLLLYSSSEMITFDFSPPPLNQIDDNSIDKYSSPSNVIRTAASGKLSWPQVMIATR